jgi:FixJ family two-component response regulator
VDETQPTAIEKYCNKHAPCVTSYCMPRITRATAQERKKAIRRKVNQGLRDRDIAKELGINEITVWRYRSLIQAEDRAAAKGAA